jgi:hypothetical protein
MTMRTSARDSAAPRRTTAATVPVRVVPRHGGRQLRRTLGNQATARVLGGEAKSVVPPAVRRVLSSPGEPLDLPTRRLMEPHFRYDLSGVRVHHGPAAAASATAVHALAYTVGGHIVFGSGQYLPGSDQGRALLAHELTHVVQQRNVDTATGSIRLGNPADDAERRADALDAEPTLRRAVAPVSTWAGTFTADPYDTVNLEVGGHVVGYGGDIGITFTPGPLVDAERISFVQQARSVKDGTPYNKYEQPEKERKTAESRMIPDGGHIDQRPTSRTPLYTPATTGWHYRDANGVVKTQDASMHDGSTLSSGDAYAPAQQTGEWRQEFEATVLATAGRQQGTYYGSVRWGWAKSASDADPHRLTFEARSMDVPTSTFMAAAELWNAGRTSDNAKPDEVPIAGLRKVAAKSADLWESRDKRVKIATLAKGTSLEQTDIQLRSMLPSLSWFWTKVTVLSGRQAGKTGWIWNTDLSPRRP